MKSLCGKFGRVTGATIGFAASLLTAHAQGILTVSPGRTVNTVAGTTATVGYTGDGFAATSATLAQPWSVAYDKSGNLFIADTNNHVIREVLKSSGTIITVAGVGTPGFSGDSGAATSAQLDTPTGIALDANGNLFIADSHNHRIREVSNGNITTVVGTGVAGFAGDGGLATGAQLNLPTGIAVDAAGNLYIADTNNQRVRKVTGSTITTVAGTGDQGYAGDGAAASAAQLDSPAGVAIDSAGNIYVADSHNQRVRTISSGTITTLAGSGLPTFGGSFSGDNGRATSATLANPTGVSVDAEGNISIADLNNQRVRQVGGGNITTLTGDGAQDPSTLNSPRGVATDPSGNVAIADTLNQRVRDAALGSLVFSSTTVGIASASQPVTLSNPGTASITVSAVNMVGPFITASGGNCSAAPITLAAGASCTMNVAFLPTTLGGASGSVNYAGTGLVTQTILLSGTAAQGATTTTLISSAATPLINAPVTFTATVAPVGTGVAPTGTVNFYLNGTTLIGSGTVSAANSSVSVAYTFTTATSYSISAVYSGDANYAGSTGILTQIVGDFSFTLSTAPGSTASQSVAPGDTATYNFTLSPLDGPFTFPITLSATGLPPGATVTFTPPTVTLGSSSANFSMAVKTAPLSALLNRVEGTRGITFAALLLVVPFGLRKRSGLRRLMVVCIAFGGLAAMGALTGCGTNSGFFGQPQKTYEIQVTGTAIGANGQTLQHSTTVSLTIQ